MLGRRRRVRALQLAAHDRRPRRRLAHLPGPGRELGGSRRPDPGRAPVHRRPGPGAAVAICCARMRACPRPSRTRLLRTTNSSQGESAAFRRKQCSPSLWLPGSLSVTHVIATAATRARPGSEARQRCARERLTGVSLLVFRSICFALWVSALSATGAPPRLQVFPWLPAWAYRGRGVRRCAPDPPSSTYQSKSE